VCESCLAGFERIAAPMCVRCGRPFESDVALDAIEPKCRLCRLDFYAFDRARSFATYDDALSEAIVVPVPLHRERRRERGYNQAELIARALAKRLKLRFDASILLRTKPRPTQLVLSRTEHWKSVRGAYATREGAQVDKLRVLLVDDVLDSSAEHQ
jgi:predicted amidophosphoribosyltransferase